MKKGTLIEAEERKLNLIRILDVLAIDINNLCAAYGTADELHFEEQLIFNAKQSLEDLLRIMRVSNLETK